MSRCSVVKPLVILCYLWLCASSSIRASAQLRLLSEHSAERPSKLDRSWPAVITHTHNWRFNEGESAGSFPDAEEELVRWCRKLAIRAVGVGSAWSPAVEANFQRFEGPDRDLYYSGRFDQKSVMDVGGVNAVLANLNAQSRGATSGDSWHLARY